MFVFLHRWEGIIRNGEFKEKRSHIDDTPAAVWFQDRDCRVCSVPGQSSLVLHDRQCDGGGWGGVADRTGTDNEAKEHDVT